MENNKTPIDKVKDLNSEIKQHFDDSIKLKRGGDNYTAKYKRNLAKKLTDERNETLRTHIMSSTHFPIVSDKGQMVRGKLKDVTKTHYKVDDADGNRHVMKIHDMANLIRHDYE